MKKTITLLSCAVLLGSAVSAQTAPPNYVSQNGLVGWWPFSGNANDQSTQSNNGTVNGAVLTTDRGGNAGSAYSFNGSTNFIEVPDAASLRVRKLTVAAWVFSTNPNPNLHDEVIYKGRKSDAYGEAFSMHLTMESGVKINSGCQAGYGWKVDGFNQRKVALEAWTHLCTTFDGSTLRNYINGVQVSYAAASGLIDSCVGSNLRFGYAHDNGNGTWAWPFLGKIDDIGIWNRALSASEIGELFGGAPIAGPTGGDTDGGPSGIAQTTVPEISLSPNPAHNTITLSRSSAGEPLQIRITDLMGRVVMQESFAGSEKTLSINGVLASGLYVVAVADTQGVLVFRQKLVVE